MKQLPGTTEETGLREATRTAAVGLFPAKRCTTHSHSGSPARGDHLLCRQAAAHSGPDWVCQSDHCAWRATTCAARLGAALQPVRRSRVNRRLWTQPRAANAVGAGRYEPHIPRESSHRRIPYTERGRYANHSSAATTRQIRATIARTRIGQHEHTAASQAPPKRRDPPASPREKPRLRRPSNGFSPAASSGSSEGSGWRGGGLWRRRSWVFRRVNCKKPLNSVSELPPHFLLG